jgi:hypothetical protein
MRSLTKLACRRLLPMLSLAFVAATPVQSADIDAGTRGHRAVVRYHRPALLPERHVVESVRPPYSGNYVFNGTWFTAKTSVCSRWVSGERIQLVAGDWNGVCTSAVFHNVPRWMTCEMWCR